MTVDFKSCRKWAQWEYKMNDRIKELFVQAYDGKFPTDVCSIHPSELERFAELIINDFLSICEESRDGYFNMRKSAWDFEEKNIYAEGETASDWIRIMTKKKFGVK